MAKLKTTCHICVETIESDTIPELCPRCGAYLANPAQETILKRAQSQCETNRDTTNGMGNLYLSNKRLLWVANSPTTGSVSTGGGIVGALIPNYQKWGFTLPLSDIKSFEDSKFGILGRAFTIKTRDGAAIKLGAKPKDEWVSAITKAKEIFLKS